ncbi:MAG: TraR/DksA C4-type zinc finger protein [Naasia sp.]
MALADAARSAAELLRSTGADIESILDARRDSSTDDEHDPEGATLAYERSQADAVRQAALVRLDEIDAARARILTGRYGFCEVCGDPIPPARLEIRPWAARCVRHA